MERLLSLKDAGEALGMSHYTLRRWAKLGRLPVVRLGARRIRVRPADLAALVQGCHVPARQEKGR